MELIEANPDFDDPIWGLVASIANKSQMYFKLGAVVFKRGKILGFGYNSNKTHPKYGSKPCYQTLHAEGAAIWAAKKLGNDTQGATMIVYRKNGLNAKPCVHCQKIIEKAGIKKVIYTNERRLTKET